MTGDRYTSDKKRERRDAKIITFEPLAEEIHFATCKSSSSLQEPDQSDLEFDQHASFAIFAIKLVS